MAEPSFVPIGATGASTLWTRPEVPDVAGTIVGFRAWGVDLEDTFEDGPRLRAVHNGATWPARRVLKARCSSTHPKEGPPPVPRCLCGIYLSADTSEITFHRMEYAAAVTGPFAYGVAEGWGRYQEHERGWRVQFARPIAVWDTAPLASLIAERYAIPVLPWGQVPERRQP